ncbi:hypothetical protein GCM10020219_074510 [Nonomuraea dietziae]
MRSVRSKPRRLWTCCSSRRGYHFAETIGTRDAVQQVYDVNVINVQPRVTVGEQERDLGPRLFGRNPTCAANTARKVEHARSRDARADTSPGSPVSAATSRPLPARGTRVVEWDAKRQMVKVNRSPGGPQDDSRTQRTSSDKDCGVLINPLRL